MIAGRFIVTALATLVLHGVSYGDSESAQAVTHWAYAPLEKPTIPAVEGSSWVRTPVDRFVLARLEEAGLTPAAEAPRRALLRRLTFDLTGLSPTPEEVAAFLADDSPDAYERRVDRLLSSPRHGERWARHWMDVVHYAETHGHDEDAIRPNAWPYRDYLIQSFNADKPYARFVAEQIAGDTLFPDDPSATVATAFLAVGPWDASSQMGIQDNTLDKEIARYLDRDDMITTTMATFTSSSVHCARCHDHKFDPISMEDYYSLQAVFAGVDRADRPFDPDPRVHQRRRELTKRKLALIEDRLPLAELLSSEVDELVAEWEASLGEVAASWTVLQPEEVVSASGTPFERLDDGSLLFHGARPEKDTYTITASTAIDGITALRLEVLTHPSLPQGGPGRQDNGNLHLSEIRVTAAQAAASSAPIPLSVRRALADFDQGGWEITRAVDGKPETAWGIYPQVGKPHAAVFELAEPLRSTSGVRLTVTLEQLHGGGHLIGRPRLLISTAEEPAAGVVGLASEISGVLSIPLAERSDTQRASLARHVLLERVHRDLAALPPPAMVYAATTRFEPQGNFKPALGPRPVHVLERGDVRRPLAEATPGALSCLSALPSRFELDGSADGARNEAARRAGLARWLSDDRNVLTWRSIANRVWHQHFGQGIVTTPNDFGRLGAAPSHPLLLDWLAASLREHGGSLKWLHRVIVTSATYRQGAGADRRSRELDSANRLLARRDPARLDAESVRDAVLSLAEQLDLSMGGPSARQFLQRKGVHVTPVVDYFGFDVDHPANRRRSVYRFVFRTLPDPFFEALDCPDASQLTPVRATSATALQALALLNSPFMVREAEHLATRLARRDEAPAAQVARLFELALARPPTERETQSIVEYVEKHGLANACRIVLNSNEFLFVE